MFLKTLLNATVISVDHIGVVPWCLIWWFIWFIVHTIYKRFFLLLLKRISVPEIESKELVRLYWNIAFISITVPFALQNLKLTHIDLIDKFYYVLDNQVPSWFSIDLDHSVGIKLSYVILSGYYLNSICEICIERGLYSLEFMISELSTLFFISTFPLRCVQFGIAVTTVINFVDFFLTISKLLKCFCDIVQTKYLTYFIPIFQLFYYVLWVVVYINVLPRYFLYASLKKMRYGSDIKHFSIYLLLNGSLFSLYAVALTNSAFTTIIVQFIRSRPQFQSKSLETNKIILTREDSENTELEKIRIAKKKENLLTLYHTVKCAIRIKRKLARIRSKINESSNYETCDQPNENDVRQQHDELRCDKTHYKEDVEELVER